MIKKWCFASLLGLSLGLMAAPAMARVLWLGNARANLLFSKEYVNVSALLPVINRDRAIVWLESDLIDKEIQQSVGYKATIDHIDVGMGGRYVWTPQFIVGLYLFANTNTKEMSVLDIVKLQEAFEINPGFELIWPDYKTAFHVNGVWLRQWPDMPQSEAYCKWAWKIEKQFDNRVMVSLGTYHTKYHGESVRSGIALGLTYHVWDALSVFGKCYYDLQERDPVVSVWNVGVQWQIGKTVNMHNRVKRYLRQSLDRHIGRAEPFKKYNYADKARRSFYEKRRSKAFGKHSSSRDDTPLNNMDTLYVRSDSDSEEVGHYNWEKPGSAQKGAATGGKSNIPRSVATLSTHSPFQTRSSNNAPNKPNPELVSLHSIQNYSLKGRHKEALAAAQQFLEQYPNSLYRKHIGMIQTRACTQSNVMPLMPLPSLS